MSEEGIPAKKPLPELYVNRDDPQYNAFNERVIKYPLSGIEAAIHLMTRVLPAGFMGLPYAFKHAGLWCGIFGVIFTGFINFYCIHMLVNSEQILCFRQKIPTMVFGDVVEQAFLVGPPCLRRWAKCSRCIANTILFVNMFAICSAYLVFAARNIEAVNNFFETNDNHYVSIRAVILMLFIPLIFLSLIRELKFMLPVSLISHTCVSYCIVVVFYYFFRTVPSPADRVAIARIEHWPQFFGETIFAMSCIGVILPLENHMKNPQNMTGRCSVLFFCMIILLTFYIIIGFFGYLQYGEDTTFRILRNLPQNFLTGSGQLMISFGVLLAITLQFFILFNILWNDVKHRIEEELREGLESQTRIFLMSICCLISIVAPNFILIFKFVASTCMSILGLILPPIIECAVYYEYPGYGGYRWRWWKYISLLLYGCFTLYCSMFVAIREFEMRFGNTDMSFTAILRESINADK